MQAVLDLLDSAIQYAPFVIAGVLILNSVGLPISEDILIITAGAMASQFPEMRIPLYAGCLIGAYFGDTSSYWVWRLLGDALLKKEFWKKRIKPAKLKSINNYFEKYGSAVLIIGRFIPFGVRVLICLSTGISKYDYRKFAFFDLIAAILSTATIFTLAYFLGESVQNDLNNVKWVLFVLAALFAVTVIIYRKMFVSKNNNQKN